MITRVLVIVMDSVGCGELPDASKYEDEGSDTLGHIADAVPLLVPTLRVNLTRVDARLPWRAPYGRTTCVQIHSR